MSSNQEETIVVRVEVGGGNQEDAPPQERRYLSAKHTAEVIFENFADLPNEDGQETESSTFLRHGKEWMVVVEPGTRRVRLCLMGEDRNVKAKVTLRIPGTDRSRSAIVDFNESSRPFDVRLSDPVGPLDQDGALVLHFDIQVYSYEGNPKTTLLRDIATLYEAPLKDVTFSVGGTTFEAHRNILLARAPALAALTQDVSPGTSIPLDDVEASIFEAFLRHLYNDQAPTNLKSHAPDYLKLADRFESKYLKLLAESELEKSLCVDNAAGLLLLGDSKNCALLKESASFFILKHRSEVMATAGWTQVSESLDLLKAILAAQIDPADDDESDFKQMGVRQLRHLLAVQGLDMVGTKETLVQRLEEAESAGESDEERASKRRRTE